MAKQLYFDFPIPDGYMLIFRASITTKSGRTIYARQFGIRGFPMLVRRS